MAESTALRPPGERGIYRGWFVLAAGFVSAMLMTGGTIYCFGLFVIPVTEEFGIARAWANQGLNLMILGMAVFAPLVGRTLDRFPAPIVMGLGGVAVGAGFVIAGRAESLLAMALSVLLLVSIGHLCAGAMAASTVATRWFQRRRGTALGIVAVSSATGGFVMVQLVTWLIRQSGWRDALVAVGVGTATIVVALALFVIRSRPTPDQLRGSGEFTSMSAAGDEAKLPFRRLIAKRNFWLLTLGAGLLLASDQAVLVSTMPYLLGLGFEPQAAAFLIGCLTLSAAVGKVAIGMTADRVDLRKLFAVVAICHFLLLFVMSMDPSYELLLAAACVLGVGFGGVHPIWSTLTASTFGSRSYGSVMGAMNFVIQPIAIITVTFIGLVYDRTNSYRVAFYVFMVFALVSLLFIRHVDAGKTAEA